MKLTERQQRVHDLKAAGYSIRAIARILGTTPTTIRDHLRAIALKHEEDEAE